MTRPKSPIYLANKESLFSMDKPGTYRIRVAGQLEQSWSNRLGGMQISFSGGEGSQKISTLSGAVIDQAALFGVLKALYDMRLPLLSVECEEFDRR